MLRAKSVWMPSVTRLGRGSAPGESVGELREAFVGALIGAGSGSGLEKGAGLRPAVTAARIAPSPPMRRTR
ncbi:hypothetical protein SKB0092_15070 [Roseomonas mucosa]